MGRSDAEDERILAAARDVLQEHRFVQTQHRLGALVNDRLAETQGGRSVTDERIRRLVASAPFARIEFKARDGEREKVLHLCPICRGSLDRVKNQTLFGGEVTLVLRCKRCGYWTGKRKRIPTLYVFHYRG